MSSVAIRVESLSKRYRIGAKEEGYRTIRESIVDGIKAPFKNIKTLRDLTKFEDTMHHAPGSMPSSEEDVIWALKDVSFDVNEGEVLGIIGRNGAGKSTLLKILSRITEPTTGFAEIRGRVSSLLEVGTGFHPELTGRENIYLNGTILGMRKEEIDRKFDEIVAFAEIEKFLDTPVKRYSSGMYVRLAFAVAAHLEPEILLVDEVLSVGDAAFQKKCLGKMGDVAKGGRTVLFVSHNMAIVESLCSRVVWIKDGMVEEVGETSTVISQYMRSSNLCVHTILVNRTDRSGSGRFKLQGVWLADGEGNPIGSVPTGKEMCFMLRYEGSTDEELNNVMVAIRINDIYGKRLLTFCTKFTGQDFQCLGPRGVIACEVSSLPLVPDTYLVDIWVGVNMIKSDFILGAMELSVVESDYYGTGYLPEKKKHGTFVIPHSWKVVSMDGDAHYGNRQET